MATEQTEAEVNAIIEQAAQSEMARIAGAPEPEVEQKETQTEADTTETETTTEQQPAAVQEPSLAEQFAQMKEENKQLRKILDRTSGTLGQEIQHIKRRMENQTPAAPNLNDVFSRLNIDDPAFADLKEEFPELAGRFVTALNKALIKQEVEKKPETEAAVVTERQTQQEFQVQEQPASNPALDRMALDTLKDKHPDFLDLAHFSANEIAPGMHSIKWKNQKFGEWLDTMPNDVREAILVGGSAEHPSAEQILRITDIMTDYKAHEAKTAATNQEVEDKKENKQESKPKPKVDLNRALLPTSRQSNKTALTEEEIIQQAMQDELKLVMNGG